MKEKKQIVVINPGSTSTKAAVFMDEDRVLDINVKHSAEELGQLLSAVRVNMKHLLQEVKKTHV